MDFGAKEKNKLDILVNEASKALDKYMKMDQNQIDKIVKEMACAAMKNHVRLAKMAFLETKRGIFEDKIIKNMFSSEYVYNYIKNKKTVGIINESSSEGYIEIADPLGVIAGVTPVTNPTSTTIFKSLLCVKTRNPIIFGFHPGAKNCCIETAKILKQAAVKAGAPEGCIGWIENPCIEATNALMNHSGVSVVLATGGAGMVKAAYSTGKPALGVGPGNVPCFVEKTANLLRACNDIILSKTFDNGMICASEQSVIIEEDIKDDFEKIMKKNGCVFLDKNQTEKLSSFVFKNGRLNSEVAGKSAYEIATMSELELPKETKILISELKGVGEKFPLSAEKLSPILSYYVVKSCEEAFSKCDEVLNFWGKGHTASIHSENEEIIRNFGIKMNAGRIIVNSPSSQGAIGGIYNSNIPSLTLGCGSHGRNSISTNLSCNHLLNIKKIFKRRNNMQWFKVPPKIYFEKNSIKYLEEAPDLKNAFIVTDKSMAKLGMLEKVTNLLNGLNLNYKVFDNVLPDPDVKTVFSGLKIMKEFDPSTIIALGGGSVIDCAKCIWLFNDVKDEDMDFEKFRLRFMDIRKRIIDFPNIHKKIKFIAIPTTSGTGSEVTSFSVITDKSGKEEIKYPLADYSLTPDVAIIDSEFVKTLPKSTVADTGMDVLTHAIEAYVSTMANDFTDGLCIKAVDLIHKHLKNSYKTGDSLSREKVHNAATIAGMAFSNAFLGLNHSMAHKLGGEFHISHGRANAILLPYVIKYNSSIPSKFSCFPKYEHFVADEKYAELAKIIGKPGNSIKESIENLVDFIIDLNKTFSIPLSLKEANINENEFLDKVDFLSELAHEDQCTLTNPRYPLISEIKDIYIKCYYGNL